MSKLSLEPTVHLPKVGSRLDCWAIVVAAVVVILKTVFN